MTPLADRGDSLRVRRHVIRARVAEPDRGTGRAVAACLGGGLADALGDRLASLAGSVDDGSVWLIRRLDVRAVVAESWTARQIASQVAADAARALVVTLDHGADGASVLWFPSRAAFLARFLLDVAAGRAAGRWEYAQFRDAAGRPASSTITATIIAEPRDALDALSSLAAAERVRVLAAITPTGARSVLDAWTDLVPGVPIDPAVAVVDALARLAERSQLPDDPHAAALAIFVEVAVETQSVPPAGTDQRARDVGALATLLRGPRAARLADAVAAGAWREVAADEAGLLAGMVAWPADLRRDAVRSLAGAGTGLARRGDGPERLTTPLGGMFLLLPLLGELPWWTATTTWTRLQGVEADRLLQYLAVIAALGADRNAAAFRDPVLRLALGIPASLDASAIDGWASGIDPTDARVATASFIRGLRERGKVIGEVTLAPLGEGVVAVDGGRGIWLGAAAASPASIGGLVELIDTAFGEQVTTGTTDAWIEVCLDPARPRPEQIDERLLARLGQQARHATLGPPVDLPPPVRELVMLAAQALARELAWRLVGFARSTLPYLWDQFLSFEASVVAESDRFVVRVGDPPLHLVLSLAGMNRRTFHLDATGARPWVLTRER